MFKRLNFTTLLQTIKQDRWCGRILSFLGQIHLIKMNVLPCLLYFFQMFPIMLSKKILTQLNSSIISFIWCKKSPRLRYSFLCLPVKHGGLARSSFLCYQGTAQFKFLLEWFIDDPNSTRLSSESGSLNRIPLQNLLHISPGKVATTVKDNVFFFF